jgi:catechol 2,3-dioxygenase-like lactoylglutathione lyase family enzyme
VPGIQASHPVEALAVRGYGHFALTSANIEPVFQRAVAAGATGVVPVGPSPEPGVRFAFVADPEGNLVELVERA